MVVKLKPLLVTQFKCNLVAVGIPQVIHFYQVTTVIGAQYLAIYVYY